MTDRDMTEHLKQLLASGREGVRSLLPQRLRWRRRDRAGRAPFRRDRLFDAAQAWPDAGQHRAPAGAGLHHAQGQGGGAADQLARRLAGAVAPDLSPHPRSRHREQVEGDRLRRGCRRLRRLHDRLRGRRNHLRPVVDRRLDRRGGRLVRFRRPVGEARHRAPALHLGREQGDARPVPAREARGRRKAQDGPAQDSRGLHRPGASRAAAAGSRDRTTSCSRANTGPERRPSIWDWRTGSATFAARCGRASATRS